MNLVRKSSAKPDFAAIDRIITNQISLCALILFFAFAVVLYTVPGAFGKFAQVFSVGDSAFAAKFDIELTAPDGFDSISQGEHYQHYFVQAGDEASFSFRIRNNSEVLVLCTPYIDSDIAYYVVVENEAQSEFVIGMGETVDFEIIVMSDGLSADITVASLFVDVQQIEGGNP